MALRSKVLSSPLAQAPGCGAHLAMLTDANRQRFHLSNEPGVLIDQVAPGSDAETMGFQAGDVIEKVGDVAVATPSEVMSRVSHGSAANGELVSVLVRGSSGTRWLTLYIGHVDEAQVGHRA